MTTTLINLLALALCNVPAPTTQPAGLNEPLPSDVELTLSPSVQEFDGPIRHGWHGLPQPTHMATISIMNIPDFLRERGVVRKPNPGDLLKTPAGRSFSDPQRQLIEKRFFAICTGRITAAGGPPAVRPGGLQAQAPLRIDYHLYATSEQDARAFAKAHIQWINQEMQARLAEMDTQVRQLEDQITAAETELPALEQKVEERKEELERWMWSAGIASAAYAQSIRLEFSKSLDLINMDLAAAEARIQTLREVGPKLPNAVFAQMSVEQDIELAGLLARKKAMEDRLKTLKDFFDRSNELGSLRKEVDRLTERTRTHGSLDQGRRRLAEIRIEFNNISLVEASIHPVAVKDTSLPETTQPGGN